MHATNASVSASAPAPPPPEPARAPDAIPLRLGEGRISGLVAVFLGVLSVAAVLCFHFPEWLTTPELRQAYPVDLLRRLLLGGMIGAAAFGLLSVFLSRSKRLGLLGVALALGAQALGGASVEVDAFAEPVVSFGLDWLILALLANSLLFVAIERVWPLRPAQPTLRREWDLDLAYYAVNHLLVGVVLLVTTWFSERLFGWAVHDGLQAWVRAQPGWLQFAEILFVADLTQYAGHRLMHEQPSLWRFHAVHHCPAEMDWLAGSRMHFAEVLAIRCLVVTPVYLLGFAESAVAAWVVLVGLLAVFVHANTRLRFGWLEQVLVTPHFHHWHHAADAEAIDRNYAATLPILDTLFGTRVEAPDRWPQRYGVVGKPLPAGFFGQLLYPFMGPGRPRSD
ncbi:MAG: sterol desaturase family protein [Myxococcota bacterium]